MNQQSPGVARRRTVWEVVIVLGLSLGASAIWSLLSLADRLTRGESLGSQTASLNTSASANPWIDVFYQVAEALVLSVPALLALYLLTNLRPALTGGHQALTDSITSIEADGGSNPLSGGARLIGLTFGRPWPDLVWAVILAAGIGLPGIGLYLAGRALGFTVEISTEGLGGYWWAVPVLILAALKNGLVEEVVAVGYLGQRLTELGWRPVHWIAASASLRGTYHLYQGFGPFFGNLVMGLVFAWFYQRTRRVMPLVVAHTLMDVVAFLGPWLIGPDWLS
ncbi:MAG: CPBP family intramembrane metalloprotease [Bifidobacteriaceae bacterium]|jgi:membrane protease YdiL (CAAX protease family)|nr:CPBP family intramembrane metalloprotease [Bifidobacteriaceae bacterium]